MDIFGQFDENSNGTVELSEFSKLWAHLGAEPLEEARMHAHQEVITPSEAVHGNEKRVVNPSVLVETPHARDAVVVTLPRPSVATAAGGGPGAPSQVERDNQFARTATTSQESDVGEARTVASISSVEREQMVKRLGLFRREQARAVAPPPLLTQRPNVHFPILVSDEASLHYGKAGQCVGHTSSNRFAIVQFGGEKVPIKENSICGHPDPAVAKPMLALETRAALHHSVALSDGDLVQVIDDKSPLYGQRGRVVSLTPSGQFLVVKFSDGARPKPLRAEAVARC